MSVELAVPVGNYHDSDRCQNPILTPKWQKNRHLQTVHGTKHMALDGMHLQQWVTPEMHKQSKTHAFM